jgi:carbohydrate kinase (thermoresistant glucokinase family)
VSCSALKRSYRRVIVGDRPDVRLVYLKGDMALIGDRISRRRNHFMPPALLKSQFDALEEPQADERPLSVPVVLSPRRVVESIMQQLGLAAPAAG